MPKKSKKAKRDGKVKTQIPYEQYTRSTNLIRMFLANQSEEVKADGILWKDVLQWYLNQPHILAEIEKGVEGFQNEKKLASQIIKRMIKNEGVIIEVENQDEVGPERREVPMEEKRLRLHPSHDQ